MRKFVRIFILLLITGTGFSFTANADEVINVPSTFASLDGSGQDADGLSNGTFTVSGNLTITGTGNITNNDVGSSGNSAGNINIVVSGNVIIQSGGGIFAENNVGGGSGGNITMDIAGSLSIQSGATISSSKTAGSGDTGNAGNITLDVTGLVSVDAGAVIKANGTGSSGDIAITSTKNVQIAGTVESASGMTGTGAQGGGTVFIITDCNLLVTNTGLVSSRGLDPGADLVHLEACAVTINGLVESRGSGHVVPSPATSVVPPIRPDKPTNSTAGVEIWANTIIIDSRAPQNGEINADLSLGAGKRSWIDILARNNINIFGDASGSLFAVHAFSGGNNGTGGIITVKSENGAVAASGNAISAIGAGSGVRRGGPITIHSKNDLNLSSGTLQSSGNNFGGAITLRSFGNSGGPSGDVVSNGSTVMNVSGATPGTVDITECTNTAYSGTVVPNTVVPTFNPNTCDGNPAFESYVELPPASCAIQQQCDQIILPVSLRSFTAMRTGNNVSLSWTTVTEVNNLGFEIQRKTKSGQDYEAVGFVQTKANGGNSQSVLQYGFTDPNSSADASYYRLKQTDFDGHYTYSEVRAVNGLKTKAGMLIYPNPSSKVVIKVIFSSNENRNIQLMDMTGRVIDSWKSYEEQQLTLSNLKPGTYFLKALNQVTNDTEIKKVIVTD